MLYNIGRINNKKQPRVLAAAGRIYEEEVKKNQYSFVVKSPLKTTNSMRVLLPVEPKDIVLKDAKGNESPLIESSWDSGSNTCYLNFENNPDGIFVEVQW